MVLSSVVFFSSCFGIVQIAHTPFFLFFEYRLDDPLCSLVYITALCAGGGDGRGRDLRWALMFCARRWAADGGRVFFERAREMGEGEEEGDSGWALHAYRCKSNTNTL